MSLERVGVSSTTFANFSMSEGPRVVSERLQGYVYAPEIVVASSVIHALGLNGNEIVYRKGMEKLELSKVYVQMHGPVFYDLPQAIQEGREVSIESAGINAMVALFAMGTVKDDLDTAHEISNNLGIGHIVLHPYGADVAYKKGLISLDNISGAVGIAIEPDYKRPKESAFIKHDPQEVLDIAQQHGTAICMDTSHDVITHNSLKQLRSNYELYKRAPGGVSNIHFSVAIPSPDGNFYTLDRGAEPLYRNTPLDIAIPYIEFVNGVLNDPDFKGNIIIEISSFPQGFDMKARTKAVKETLDMLFDRSTPKSYSIPNQ